LTSEADSLLVPPIVSSPLRRGETADVPDRPCFAPDGEALALASGDAVADSLALGAAVAIGEVAGDVEADADGLGPCAGGAGLLVELVLAAVPPVVVDPVVVAAPVVVELDMPAPAETP